MNRNIIRRLDDFGRITLPSDMRRAMHLEVSDPVEIIYEDKKITITPYITLSEIEYFLTPCLKVLKHSGDNHYVFTTRNEINVSCIEGVERGVMLTEALTNILRLRKDQIADDFSILLTEHSRYAVTAVFPIISAGDLHGGVMIVTNDNKPATDDQLIKARFLRDILAQEVEGL